MVWGDGVLQVEVAVVGWGLWRRRWLGTAAAVVWDGGGSGWGRRRRQRLGTAAAAVGGGGGGYGI